MKNTLKGNRHKHTMLVLILIYLTIFNKNCNLPVVKAGVHSCSPVAPHNRVRLFVECLTVVETDEPGF